MDIDLLARRVAFSWTAVPAKACPGTVLRNEGQNLRSEVWTVTLNGRRTRLARVCDSTALFPVLTSATLTGDRIAFLRRPGATGDAVEFVLPNGERQQTPLDGRPYDAAVDGSALYWVRASPQADRFEIVADSTTPMPD